MPYPPLLSFIISWCSTSLPHFHSWPPSTAVTWFNFIHRSSCIQFDFLYSLGHLRSPNLSQSLTSHILSDANLAFSVFLPFTPSLTHSSIMHTLCLMHTHCLLYTCRLQHTYCLRHIHCSVPVSSWMFFTLCASLTQLTFFLSFIPDISSTMVPQSTLTSFHHCSGLLLELLALCTLILDAYLLHNANLTCLSHLSLATHLL